MGTDYVDGHGREPSVELIKASFGHQVQPTVTSCLPAAFAMVMDVPVADVLKELGHDDIRGFHPQELIGLALRHGWVFQQHDFSPSIDEVVCPEHGCCDKCQRCGGTGFWKLNMTLLRIDELMQQYNGVLIGSSKGSNTFHAVAWCRSLQKCLDPKGLVTSLSEFEPDAFFLAMKSAA